MANKPLPDPYCPYCGKSAELIDSVEIYKYSYGMVWICRPCDAYTGVHESSKRNAPLGTLANLELRKARQQVHSILDPLWQTGPLTRTGAYEFLASLLKLSPKRCHVAMFDLPLCRLAIKKLKDPF